jgi:tetratricopeptide (TPR) repeat protein
MIYWGLTLALGPNPNSRAGRVDDDPQGEAARAIRQARTLIDNANEQERGLIDALFVRFDADSYPDREVRDAAYLDAARALFERYPRDPDAGVLVADAYMVTTPWRYWGDDGEPMPGTSEAAAALERVMAMRPDHPGANHLYIHLFESSRMPEQALPAADRLAGLMPGVGHVVHMPGHIYVRVGQHSESIDHNQRSAAADAQFLEAWGDHAFPQIGTYFLSAQNHRRHAYDFIRYSAAMQGKYAAAVEAATNAREHEPEARVRLGPAQKTIATRWLVHKLFGRWNALLAEDRVMQGELYLDGLWYYTQGSARAGIGDLEAADRFLEQLRAVAAEPGAETIRRNANSVTVLMTLAGFGLEGEIKEARGDLDGAIAAFESAVAIEDSLNYQEPPDWPQPMRQYLGAALLAAGRPAGAEAVYRADLAWNQQNPWSLFGLTQSLEAQGREAEAQRVRADFEAAWRGADTALERSRF